MDYYDILLAKFLSGGGGPSVDIEPLTVTENGTYTAQEGKAYSPVVVNVEATVQDQVLPNGGIVKHIIVGGNNDNNSL